MTYPPALPGWDDCWALFLDVDGTLLEIQRHPDEVRAPPGLRSTLASVSSSLDGALALVSGRAIASVDRVFAPLSLPTAGLHGLERRDAAGRVHYPEGYAERITSARAGLQAFAQSEPGLLLEDKGAALALHYRGAPALEPECLQRMELARALAGEGFHVQRGKMVLELKPSGHDKGKAVHAFMAEQPFRGRRPVFVGDDVTDEDGFAAANELGGISIRVGPHASTAAQVVVPDVQDILAWLQSATEPRHAATY